MKKQVLATALRRWPCSRKEPRAWVPDFQAAAGSQRNVGAGCRGRGRGHRARCTSRPTSPGAATCPSHRSPAKPPLHSFCKAG